jgi:heavy metal sensor kinase
MLLKRLPQLRFVRTLRFRLASTFLLLLLVILTIVGGAGTVITRRVLESRTEETLVEELAALKGYLHFDHGLPVIGPAEDDDDRAEIARLTKVYLIADAKGHINKGTSDRAFDAFTDSAEIRRDLSQIRALPPTLFKSIAGDEDGPYEVIATIVLDDLHREWYVAVGRSVAGDKELFARFRRDYLIFLALASVLCMGASWYSAGRGLRTLQSVEQAAKGITGSNLGLQIPQRGADDELDRLVGSFNQMSRRLKASFDQVRQFSTDVSHELRTPLTAIQGQLEVALFTAARPEQLREAIENALQDVERLSNLIRALLLLSQSETGQIPMNKSRVDLYELVSDIVEQFQIPAEADNLTLTCVNRGQVFCDVDRTQMERVITNLLSNATKYTQAGGWINAWVEQVGDSVKLVVQDSGLGIPAGHLPHIFDRFYRVPDPNPEKGLGLGLSFVASIVRAHQGEIHVESAVGSGSTFTVTLPGASSLHTSPEDLVVR